MLWLALLLIAVNRPHTDAWVCRQSCDLLPVLVRELVHVPRVCGLADVVGLNVGGEDREAILGIQLRVIAAAVDACRSTSSTHRNKQVFARSDTL